MMRSRLLGLAALTALAGVSVAGVVKAADGDASSIRADVTDVTASNWYWGPGNTYSWHNMRRLFPTARIGRGTGNVVALKPALRDLSAISFTDPVTNTPMTVGEMLDATNTDGFIVLHHGKIVAEEYRNDMRPDDPHLLMSMTKSIVGTLAGILVERGEFDTHKLITDYIPELVGTVYDGATVRDAMDMAVADKVDPEDLIHDYNGIDEAAGWLPVTPTSAPGLKAWLQGLRRPHGTHGERFLYLTQSTTVLSWAMENATGRDFATMLTDEIWSKLGAQDDAYILLDRQQEAYTSPGLNVTLRDLARFGQMMAQGGRYNEQQIVPTSWVDDIKSNGNNAAWLKSDAGRMNGGALPGHQNGSYRSFWWVADKSCGRFAAIGLGAQLMVIDPVADMVVIKFSSAPDPAKAAAFTRTQYYGIDAVIRTVSGHGC